MEYDTLLHMSSGTETVLRSINNILVYFMLWTGGSEKQLTYISLNHLCNTDVIDSGIAKYSVGNIKHTSAPNDFSNAQDHYLQGYWEVKDGEDYSAISLKLAFAITPTIKLQGKNDNWCFVTKYRRHSDFIEFYFIQMTQKFGGYFWKNSYKGISELLQYILKYFPGRYIIVGNFNVHGHEKIFEHYLGTETHHICPFYKTVTCNDDDGIASPDGLVVSKELYTRIEYAVDFYSGYNYQHFIISAKLYPDYHQPGVYDITDAGFIRFLRVLKRTYGVRKKYVNEKGIFSSSNAEMVGSLSNIRKTQIPRTGAKTFIATKKITEL